VTRTKPAEERRADLLGAAETLFVRNGIDATSLDEITSAAGVSKGLFYVYFRSKEEIVAALQEQLALAMVDRINAAIAEQTDWGAKLDAVVQASFDAHEQLRDLHDALFHRAYPASRTRDSSVAQRTQGVVVEAIGNLLRAGNAAGAYTVDDPVTETVMGFLAMFLFNRDLYSAGSIDDHALIRAAQQLFRRAVGLTG
jgi:AcrR family transcriptional regulator